jgi:hypothetical protein
MSAIIKRKLRETWRDAVAARVADRRPEQTPMALATFDGAVSRGEGQAEAAFATLSALGLLWHVEGAGFTAPPSGEQGKHSVPSV